MKSIKKAFTLLIITTLFSGSLYPQKNEITIDPSISIGEISPFIYGQFIEYMGRCIDGGIYEENSLLSDKRGFRIDVLEKVKDLNPTMLRFPGGTVIKTFHWEDGVGPKEQRKAKKNLIWGGVNNYHFGTCEFIEYSEPFNVKYWALGNEEMAEPDAGRHQDPHKYVEDVWHFIKLMKLTDPTIKLIANGESGTMEKMVPIPPS